MSFAGYLFIRSLLSTFLAFLLFVLQYIVGYTNKMRLNVCFNEMTPFGPFAAFIKGCSTHDKDGRDEGEPTRRVG